MCIDLHPASEVVQPKCGPVWPIQVLMVLLIGAGSELVLLYYFCSLNSGGGCLCFTKREGCIKNLSCALFLIAASLDPCSELHIILGERKKIFSNVLLANKYFLQILTLLRSFFSKGIENSTYCAPYKNKIHLYIYFLIFNLDWKNVCAPQLE